MAAHSVPSAAATALRTYDAIAHDLAVRPSAVLRRRLEEVEAEILTLTGASTLARARQLIPRASRRSGHPDPHGQQKNPRGATRAHREQSTTPPGRGKPKNGKKGKQRSQPDPGRAARRGPRPHYELRGQDRDRRPTAQPKDGRSYPTHVTGVVSGGLPGTSRRR